MMESIEPFNLLWEDKEIKFDTANIQNRLRNGENVLSTIYHIEDTKGNPGHSGRLLATNLRLIWYSLAQKKFNLSIGYSCIAEMYTKTVPSRTCGEWLALYILAIGGRSRFEFLFKDISGESDRKNRSIFDSVINIHNLYNSDYLYRDIKLRGGIIKSGQLRILNQEQIFNKVNGVWNLSSDQGNLGSFIVSNIRVVWYADANEIFNISLPYLQIANIRIRESKYGPALVIETAETGGGYVLGFRIDPPERLAEIFQELISLHSVYTKNPNFGLCKIPKQNTSANSEFNEKSIEMFPEIDELQERELYSKLNNYLALDSLPADEETQPRQPVYCKELGFAVERLHDGFKLKDLWDVLPQQIILTEEE